MDHPMTEEESYAERRQLFKNIWDTAVAVDEKGNVNHKPKVIKTLQLADQCVVGKKKKQRSKKLRIVCNKLLNFCDRHDTDDMFYKQMASQDQQYPSRKHRIPKKSKIRKVRKVKKANRVKSMCTSIQGDSQIATTSSTRIFNINKFSINSSPFYKNATSMGAAENYLQRDKIRRVQQYIGTITSRKYKNKQPFPIHKITIDSI